jgi:hypothetical protein
MEIYRLLKRRALVSRGAAQAIVAAIRAELDESTRTLELDFSGVEAVAPSFVDELIAELTAPGFAHYERILFSRPPSRLSEKFRAIGRGRGISIEETPAHEWIIARSPTIQGAE